MEDMFNLDTLNKLYECAALMEHAYICGDKDEHGRSKYLSLEKYGHQIREYNIRMFSQNLRAVCICGTNDMLDWMGNFDLRWKNGWKRCAEVEASRIRAILRNDMFEGFKKDWDGWLIIGHSKGAGTALCLADKLLNELPAKRIDEIEFMGGLPVRTVAFAPARSVAPFNNVKMRDTLIAIDGDDIVPKLGRIFHHPKCEELRFKRTKRFFSLKDHSISGVVQTIKRAIRRLNTLSQVP